MKNPQLFYLLIITILFASVFHTASAQRIDSLKLELAAHSIKEDTLTVNLLLDIAAAYEKKMEDSLLNYASRALKIADLLNFEKGVANANYLLGMGHYRLHNFDSARKYLFIAEELLKSRGSYINLIETKTNIGNLYNMEGEFQRAIQENMQIMSLVDSLSNNYYKAITLNNIGEIYRFQRDGKMALKYLTEAYNLADSLSIRKLMPKLINNKALAHDLCDQRELALEMLLSAFEYSDLLGSNDSAILYSNIGREYNLLGNFVEAEKYLFKALDIRKNLHVPFSIGHLYNEISTVYLFTEQYDKAIEYGNLAYPIMKELNHIFSLKDIFRNMSDAWEGKGNYVQALKYQREYVSTLKNVFDKEKAEILHEMEAKYNTSEKEKEIIALEAEKRLMKQSQNGIIIGLIMLALVFVLVAISMRLKIKKKTSDNLLSQSNLKLKNNELVSKQKELDHYLHIIKEKNHLIEQIEDSENIIQYENIEKLTNNVILTEDDWLSFKQIFEEVHSNFFVKLRQKFPEFTTSEVRITALMKLNLTNKEIARMLGISPSSVIKSKYRLKKKLNLEEEVKLDAVLARI